ncbi:2-C-methyl-D-erythritol 4-phosphate cytidylyltransferase [Fusobacterium sp. DD29]|uniref:2-C-methyl-D-erythritol 4-phosphate cytidylyltransferase n=1 Tax=unclassified Fusobacterium TaxID=2648384 RepID=UPI001B8C9CB1|nr:MULTISPECIES: 2-C-methyl-D-erythritol 4-phosphate cytidylyltransferase [unclassified Fusobacterium]MBR8701994.1 2-C-methyl-D-erythritol 4-phosphate cytidylyltransferase [Fusobacterium sp. DD45]MBR8711791.1 2-C-methyl-D-erythritol 4-phosphate cytidylyltransferase [Fusobacterium sp. DD28]MBR8750215.1 2-C-methyl-D-erythritol 4-phosphate cytidylyltransferase [Fusobacterium sp. DD29]MBR8752357.1 2-C-methyl-D-erythritol 4-phosphate cytidylyltransferase [Fusobacterium sp. DD26]MBR8762457.1 2-C-met
MYCGDTEIEYKVTVIVAAAGVGKRMKLGYPKQFLEWNGKPLFITPLEVANNCSLVDDIIVTTNKENVEIVKNLCRKFKITKVKAVTPGGKERQNSIYNALLCDENSDIILVQDGVRPFLKEKYIKECCDIVVKEKKGAIVGVKVKDTIKIINENMEVVSTPLRENLIAVHTPQAFPGNILKDAYKKAEEDEFLGTDDASLVERMGYPVKIVPGDYDNVKITTQEDLKFLK